MAGVKLTIENLQRLVDNLRAEIPTSLSQLSNEGETVYATKSYVDDLIGSVNIMLNDINGEEV